MKENINGHKGIRLRDFPLVNRDNNGYKGIHKVWGDLGWGGLMVLEN